MSDPVLQQILTALTGVQTDLNEMRTEFSEMKSEISGMKSEISGMKSEISEIRTEINEMKTEIASIKEDTRLIPLIQQAVSEVNAEVIATRDTIERIEETLRGHDVTLDLLSRRSIDQEAALKRIK
ncbi:histidine kinase [Paenibacillus sonchi]|uniref:Histidine kinase n=1 Tax=Paenibacillus sonchi TaxID=373687 RepID=A0A974PD81_9BACL|nr:histidine kinase [Paenibacillus sonchi]QQZ61695.1 histidine kinase [Paenibacillus sonchi]